MPLAGATLRAHVDGNYDSGYFVNATDPLFVGAGNAANVDQPKGDRSFVVNGTLALADIDMGRGGAKVTVSVWARNLLNEQHVFYRAFSLTRRLERLLQRAAHVRRAGFRSNSD